MIWKATLLRFTLFPGESKQIVSQDWWQQAVGPSPDEVVTKPKSNEQLVAGVFGDGRLVLQASPARIDWIYSALPLMADAEGIPQLGPVESTFSQFTEPIERWLALDSCPTAGRVAFGAILDSEVDTKEDGYTLLNQLLPSVEIDSEAEDFQFQINRPRIVSVLDQEIRVNRLSRWSVIKLVEVQLGSQLIQLPMIPTEGYVHLELDINTDQKFGGVFSRDLRVAMFRSLRDMAVEIASQGDMT